MTDTEKIAVLIAGRKAFEYALEHCSEELTSRAAVIATKQALAGSESDVPNNHRLTAS